MRRSRERQEMWVSWSRNVYAREMAHFNVVFLNIFSSVIFLLPTPVAAA